MTYLQWAAAWLTFGLFCLLATWYDTRRGRED